MQHRLTLISPQHRLTLISPQHRMALTHTHTHSLSVILSLSDSALNPANTTLYNYMIH